MYKQLIVIYDGILDEKLLDGFDYLIIPSIKLINTYKGEYNNEIYDFDYLIISSKISKQIMSEDGFIITNNVFETSVDNYFAIGKCIRSTLSINEQLNIIIENLKGN